MTHWKEGKRKKKRRKEILAQKRPPSHPHHETNMITVYDMDLVFAEVTDRRLWQAAKLSDHCQWEKEDKDNLE